MRTPFNKRSRFATLHSRKARTGNCFRPYLELLEDRRVLSAVVVTTFADVVANDGQTSLREAIAQVAALPGDDTIELPAGTYPLSLGQLTINDASGAVTIQSTGGVATVDAQFTSHREPIKLDGSDPKLSATVAPLQATLQDVNGDGRLDLLLKFSTDELVSSGALDADSTSVTLTAFTTDGLGIIGTAPVHVVG